jgi:hypothetical protein
MAIKKEERGFSYKKRSKESLKERANMKGGNFDTYIKPKFKQWKPKDGKNLIRILPPTWEPDEAPWQSTEHYGLDIFVNFNIGADNQAYLSLSKHGKGEDPIAEARKEAAQEGEKDFAKKLQPSQRILYWIIDRNDEDEGPLLWAAPFTFDKSLSNLCIDEDTKEVIFIDDPQKGRDVRFYKEGSGLKTTYDSSKMKVLGVSSINEDEGIEEEWLEYITENPLPSVLNFYEYDHIKASFDGRIGSFDSDDEDEKPNRKRKPSKEEDERPTRRNSREVSDSDEEVEKPTTSRRNKVRDEDEADEKPARRRAVKNEAPDDEDGEVEEKPRKPKRVVDDEDDEVKPSHRSRTKVEEEDDDEDPPSTRRTGKSRGDDDEDEGRGGSLRERLAARRRSRTSDDD